MMLESLPNELLLAVFQYMDIIHLLHAFHKLNSRFSQLLSVTRGNGNLDCCGLSKQDFEWFSRDYFVLIDSWVTFWRFSDDLETPDFSRHFLASGHPINRLLHLKSLSIDRISSFERLNQITNQLRKLSHLTHLRIAIQNDQDRHPHFRDFIDDIWSLSVLTHCDLDIIYPYTAWLFNISTISTSIRYLFLKNIICDSDTLTGVFQHTPHLRRLCIGTVGPFPDQTIPIVFPSLLSLSIAMNAQSDLASMRNLFQRIPNVRHLTVEVRGLQLDGQQWQEILSNHFQYLQGFRLKMSVVLTSSEDIEEQVDVLLDSFRSEFWIVRHRWFVQCHWSPRNIQRTGLLYTLPYPSDMFDFVDGTRCKSTHPDQFDDSSYEQVTTLHHTNQKRDFNENHAVWSVSFQSVRHLKISLPFDENFWSQLGTLTHLTSLDVNLNQTFGYSQLQIFLDRAPHLYSLRFSQTSQFSIDTFQITSASLRRLELFQDLKFILRYFSAEECATFAQTPIASQCEVLLIDLAHRTTILELIATLPKLRALCVRCQTDLHSSFVANEELIEWLQEQLPSTYTCSIDRGSYIPHINLWIGRD